jgi:tetratricopeptide (TPR) repeat protein
MSDTGIELVRRAERARREKRLADAHRHLVEAVAVCRQARARFELVLALKGLGQSSGTCPGAARPLYEEAVAICREGGDALTLAHTVRHLGDVHRHAGRLELAEPCCQVALALYRSHEDTRPLALANAIRPLAILKQNAGETEEARRLWQEAKDLYTAANVQEGVAGCSTWLARLGG